MKLTQKTIAALILPEGKSDHIEWDNDLPGFGVRLRRGGSARFIFQYKLGAQHRRIVLGSTTALTPRAHARWRPICTPRFAWAVILPARRLRAERTRERPWAPSRTLT